MKYKNFLLNSLIDISPLFPKTLLNSYSKSWRSRGIYIFYIMPAISCAYFDGKSEWGGGGDIGKIGDKLEGD